MKTTISLTDEYDSRAHTAERKRLHEPRAPLVPRVKPARHGFEKGDLLAVPLCILWGVGLWASYGLMGPLGSGDSGSGVSLLWSVPLSLVRFLFGG